MRARQFIFEYNQAKTAEVFGSKLLNALASDKGSHFGTLGGSREYLRQKDKIGIEPDEQNKNYIIKAILQDLENADPTPTKEYTQWLAKCYANEAQKIEDLTSKGRDWLNAYHMMKVKRILPANMRNIANYKFSQLYDIVNNDEFINQLLHADEKAAQKNMPRGESTTVFDNDQVRVIVPTTEEAACYYGQGTQWCTAARNNNMFHRYNKEGKMYILLPKQPSYTGEKYQLHFSSSQFMDETDSPVSLNTLLQDRFPGLLEFFKQAEPEIKNIVVFADDEVLAPILQRIGEMAMDQVNDMITEWEHSDNYYYESLVDAGYANEDGDIDWERVSENNADYLSFDDGAREFYNNAESSVFLSPQEARNYAAQIAENNNDDESIGITELEKTVVASIDEHIREDDGGYSLKKFVNEHVYVTRDKESGQFVVKDLNR